MEKTQMCNRCYKTYYTEFMKHFCEQEHLNEEIYKSMTNPALIEQRKRDRRLEMVGHADAPELFKEKPQDPDESPSHRLVREQILGPGSKYRKPSEFTKQEATDE